MEYKVGDEVIVTGRTSFPHYLKIGSIATVIETRDRRTVFLEGINEYGQIHQQTLLLDDVRPLTPLEKAMK